jgi:hypothetical protein
MITWSPSALARAGLTIDEAETLALSATPDPDPVPDAAQEPVPVVVTAVQPASVAAEVERYLALYEEQRPT